MECILYSFGLKNNFMTFAVKLNLDTFNIIQPFVLRFEKKKKHTLIVWLACV